MVLKPFSSLDKDCFAAPHLPQPWTPPTLFSWYAPLGDKLEMDARSDGEWGYEEQEEQTALDFETNGFLFHNLKMQLLHKLPASHHSTTLLLKG